MAMLLAGAAAFTQLPVAPLPRVDFPTISVTARCPAPARETMASAVATPLERRFGRIAGVTEMTSTSHARHRPSITLQFDLDRDVDVGRARRAGRDQRRRRRAAAEPADPPELPQGQPGRRADPDPLAHARRRCRWRRSSRRRNTVLAQKISQVDGVGQVFVGGGQQPAVRVQVDPAALAGAG